MRYICFNLFGIMILSILVVGCGTETNDLYTAEKMFYNAEKITEKILTNSEIASPEEFGTAENAYREIINRFSNQKDLDKETREILRRSWLTVAQLFQIQKKSDKAIQVYKEIIEKSQNDNELSAVAKFYIARIYEQDKNFDAAIECYQNIIADYPPVLGDTLLPNYGILRTPIHIARLYRHKGNRIMSDNKYDEAQRYYEAIVNKYPNSEIALAAENQIAVVYSDQGLWEKSAEILNSIIMKHPEKKEIPNIMYNLGQVYQSQLNRPDKALQVYQRIIQKFPQNPNLGKVRLAMGGIYFSREDYNSARNEFKYVIDNFRTDINSCISAQMAIARSFELENNWNKALNEYQWVINNYPTSMQALNIPLYIADHYEKDQKHDLAKNAYQSAVKQFQQIVNKYPNTPLAGLALDYSAASYIKLEQWDKAAETYELLLAMEVPSQKRINTLFTLENIYEKKLNDAERALQTCSRLLAENPKIKNESVVRTKAQQLQQKIELYKQTNKPPVASEIIAANLLSTSSLALQWRPNNEIDFSHYKLMRSDKPGIDLQGKIVSEISDRQQIEFIDNDVREGRTYYYRLFTFDRGGLNSASREVNVTVEAKQIVATIHLQARSENWASVSLNWNQYNGNDFDSYKIYRSSSPGVSLNSKLVRSVFDQQQTQLVDTDLKENTTYYYKSYVFNSDGANKPSNEVEIKTQVNTPPRNVTLNRPRKLNGKSVELSWSACNESDFSMYRIFRAESSPVSLDGASIWMSSLPAITNYKDVNLINGKTYYYKIAVYDKGGLFSESNEVSITF